MYMAMGIYVSCWEQIILADDPNALTYIDLPREVGKK